MINNLNLFFINMDTVIINMDTDNFYNTLRLEGILYEFNQS